MNIKRAFYILVVLVMLLIPVLGATDKPGNTVTVTDLAGRTVTIDSPIKSAVITFYFEEYLAVEGGENPFSRITGWSREYWEGRRQWTWDKYTSAFPSIKDIPDVGYVSKNSLSVEKVISLKPDVVIMALIDYETEKDDVSKLEKAGIPVVFIDYHAETLEAHNQSTMVLGKILGREERAQELMDFYKKQTELVTSRLKGITGSKPRVYIEPGNLGPAEYDSTYGKGYMWGGLIDTCRGINVAEGVVEAGKGGAISPEYLLKQNPDVIIITGTYWPSVNDSMRMGYGAQEDDSRKLLKAFTERPGWKDMNAVKNGNVYCIDHSLSRSIADFVATQCLVKCLYPSEFYDLDPTESFKEFHKRFLPIEYSGLTMISLNPK